MKNHSFTSGRSDEIQKTDQEIREYFGQETDETLRMGIDGIVFTLIQINADNEENIRRFSPYCNGSPVGKYGLIWSAPCLRDFYVFDTREHAVDFIVLSRVVGRG